MQFAICVFLAVLYKTLRSPSSFKSYVFLMLCLLFRYSANGQYIKTYGEVTSENKKVAGVLVCVYENDVPFKRTFTNNKGQFFFKVDNLKTYTALFYKDAHLICGYRIINKLEFETHKLPIYVEMQPTKLPQDTLISQSLLLKQLKQKMATDFIERIFVYEAKRKTQNDSIATSNSKRAKKILLDAAIAERDRFKKFEQQKSKTVKAAEDLNITITKIGPDTYELVENRKLEKQYFKNEKPITESTYLFETTRRYEGVLKNVRKAKRFKKYIPEEHVK